MIIRSLAPSLLLLATTSLSACGDRAPAPRAEAGSGADAGAASCADPGVREVVERFGERMKMVSTLAPDSIAARAVREAYADLVTPALLDRWSADPAHAPGKDVSSPWPERIRIDSVAAAGTGACRVSGEIVYVTSAEVANGGAAALAPVTLGVASDGGWRISAFDAAPPASPTPPAPPPPAPGAASGSTPTPAPATPDSTLTPAEVIRRYYAAIDAKDYRRAFEMWGNGGAASGQSFDAFRAGFARTAGVEVEIGEVGRVEGAAGSRYVDVPVVVRARTTEGGTQRFEGSYTLRRTVVDGSTPAQRRWHIDSAKLTQTR
jgi:hypothetical protein